MYEKEQQLFQIVILVFIAIRIVKVQGTFIIFGPRHRDYIDFYKLS